MVMAPSNPDIIYAGEVTGIFKTTDGGDSWQKMSNSKVRALSVAQNNPDLVSAREVINRAKANKAISRSDMLPQVRSDLTVETAESAGQGQTVITI